MSTIRQLHADVPDFSVLKEAGPVDLNNNFNLTTTTTLLVPS